MTSPLGDFLKSSRSRVAPSAAGLPTTARRRVAGLRREEVARLAGVSADYYTRLEQGRESSPSPQVVDSIGRVLLLDEHGLTHLYRLAGLTPTRAAVTSDEVDSGLVSMIHEWPEHPALVLGHAFDVVAANPLAEALFLGFPPRRNLIESIFLDPASRTLYRDWREIASNTVAGFRLLYAAQPDDAHIREVLAALEDGSDDFAAMWADHLARGRRLPSKRFLHPRVGALELQIQAFDVRAAAGQELVVYRAVPGTPDAAALGLLRNLAAVSSPSASRPSSPAPESVSGPAPENSAEPPPQERST
jgi:transcriptional regulator with XRE-family HTH domain